MKWKNIASDTTTYFITATITKKKELVNEPGEWIYSSWRNYYLDDDSVFRIDRVEML